MELDYHPGALGDLKEATRWYEDRRKGLGREFIAAYEYALAQIMRGPDKWPTKAENIRQHRTKRFPYGIYFAVDGDLVRILAVCHFHRDERHWRSRLKH